MHGFALHTDWRLGLNQLAHAGYVPAQAIRAIYAEHASLTDSYAVAQSWRGLSTDEVVAPTIHPPVIGPLLRQFSRRLLGRALRPATVVDPETGESRRHPVRQSSAVQWLPEWLDWPGKLIEQTLAEFVGYPADHGEVLTLLHYSVGEQYRAHFDALPPDTLDESGQRSMTVLCNVGDTLFKGGETSFPRLDVAAALQPGELLRFNNVDADGAPASTSLHCGEPVTEGEKWMLSKWVRAGSTPYGAELNLRRA